MFCSQCGDRLNEGARFCSACGAPVPGEIGAASTTQGDLVDLALGPDPIRAEVARSRIIESVDLIAMDACASRSLSMGDLESAEFWYLETITADGAPVGVIREAILAYCRKILETAGRLSELELQYYLLSTLDDRSAELQARAGNERLVQLRQSAGALRHEFSDEWRSVDVSHPLDPASAPRQQYLRTIAFLSAKVSAGDIEVPPAGGPDFIPLVEGLMIGMRKAIADIGADLEAAAQGTLDWLLNRPGLEDVGDVDDEVESTVIGPGQWLVGEDVAPGLYRFEGYAARLDRHGGVITNENVRSGLGLMLVSPHDAVFEVNGHAIRVEDMPSFDVLEREPRGGIYLVGPDLSPGRYRVHAEGRLAYIAMYDRNLNLLKNDTNRGGLVVSVPRDVFAFQYSGRLERLKG